MTATARAKGFKRMFVPEVDAGEAALIPDLEVYTVKLLADLYDRLSGRRLSEPYQISSPDELEPLFVPTGFAEIKGRNTSNARSKSPQRHPRGPNHQQQGKEHSSLATLPPHPKDQRNHPQRTHDRPNGIPRHIGIGAVRVDILCQEPARGWIAPALHRTQCGASVILSVAHVQQSGRGIHTCTCVRCKCRR
jgi:hypothetical protein